MAPRKGPRKSDISLTTRAFENGAEAAGASAVKPGFASSTEHDLWFALGYPHVAFVADGHPDDSEADFDEWRRRCFDAFYGIDPAEVPRAVAVRRLRAQGCEVIQNPDGSYSDECRRALMNPEPLSVEEAKDIVARHFRFKTGSLHPGILFEALFGPDTLLETLLPHLERITQAELAATNLTNAPEGYYTRTAGYLLRRAKQPLAEDGRRCLMAVFRRASEAALADSWSLAHQFGYAVGGAEYMRKYGYRVDGVVDPSSLDLSDDDPEFVRSEVMKSKIGPPHCVYPRLVFIGGDELVDYYQAVLKKLDGRSQRNYMKPFGLMKTERARELMLWFATHSKTKKDAVAWFREHAEETRELLERHAAGEGPEAKTARSILAKL